MLTGVVWSGSQFVGVGDYGKVMTSPDGMNWTYQTLGATDYLTDITWSGSLYVAVGYGDKDPEGPAG